MSDCIRWSAAEDLPGSGHPMKSTKAQGQRTKTAHDLAEANKRQIRLRRRLNDADAQKGTTLDVGR
jgi:hypothetical protein